jgi:hypothetical protein|tara:strand:- start:300 stop:719 length:420 start_codon:yes stop_codon:yes gene_type:complete
MKKFILISSLFFLPLLVFSQEKQAEVKFDVTTIDYGEVEFESDGKRIFKFKNIGTAPLVFTRISSSCGCTIPKKPEKPIEPGGEGEIEVEYDTKREGLFMKAISVVSNSKNPSTILRIKGEVLPEEEEEEEEEEEKGKD